MTFVPTTIASAVGDKSLGKPAANKPDDVRKIQALLKKALGPAVPPLKDSVCDAAMKNAIAQFQQLWGSSADGTVDPHGQTIKRLDRLANPLELKPISLTKVLET